MGFAKGKNLNLRSMKHPISAFLTALALCLSVFSYAWATPPPQDNFSYRGDVNGDFVVTLSEVVAVRDLASLKTVDCTAVVPGTVIKCDTADLSGDSFVTLADVVAIRDLSALKPYTTPDLSWTLDISGIPANVTDSAPIQAAITNISGIGRPGIVVRFSIVSGPATLSGREYNPADDGIRDHASPPGATQVLAITQTDFPGVQTGATELTIPNVGTPVELVCTGDGTVSLNVDVLVDALKGIPALSATPSVECIAGPATECNDGIDNDGDTFTDFPGDPGCTDAADTSELGIPTLAGYYNTPDMAKDIFVQGNYAYVADDNMGGLQVIDVSDPSSPTFAGSYNTTGYAQGIYVSGNYAYIADGTTGLQIIDISVPTSPTFAGSYDTPDMAKDVFVSGNYAYVADDNIGGLQIIDVSVPSAPTFAGSNNITGYAQGVFVSGDYAYVADGATGLQIINVSVPTSPTFAGSYDTADYARDVYVSGNYAYVADDNVGGLQIVDVSTPSAPVLAGSYTSIPGNSYGVFVSGNYAYVTNTISTTVIDVTDPANPALVDEYYSWGGDDVFISGNYLYVAASTSGLTILFTDTAPPDVYECNDLIDNDGDTLIDYSVAPDTDCTSLTGNSEGIPTECSDTVDNDGDTYTDFPSDPGCSDAGDTSELGGFACDDGIDNDGDTLIDVANDPGCTGPTDFNENGTNECDNGADDDGDTSVDFPNDPGCSSASDLDELGTNECDDGLDNDGDSLVDYPGDSGCSSLADTTEEGECQDGLDNDADTLIDFPSDPGCTSLIDLNEGNTQCEDGIDNDGDTTTDFPNDPGCSSVLDLDELGTNECDDGVDNDGDTNADTLDPGCIDVFDDSEFGKNECDDGIDNDGDTQVDYPDDSSCTSPEDYFEGGNQCDDGIDNDGDTQVDYPDDSSCTSPRDYSEGGNQCDDGIDNDGDTQTDFPSDPECSNIDSNSEYNNIECNDSIDNDGDTFVDYPDDTGCTSASDDSESTYIHVWVDSLSPTEDGSIANPYKSIQAGINVAVAGQDVRVALGTYLENLEPKTDVDLWGGFDSNFDYDDRQPNFNRTIIKPPSGSAISNEMTWNLLDIVIDGFEIAGGSYGIQIYNSAPTISNNYIHSTDTGLFLAAGFGGFSSSPYIIDNTILDTVIIFSNPIGNNDINATIKYCTINTGDLKDGIIVENYDGDMYGSAQSLISNSIITGDTALSIKSHMFNSGACGFCWKDSSASGTIQNSIINDSNTAIYLYAWAKGYGPIYPPNITYTNSFSSAILENVILADNYFGITAFEYSSYRYRAMVDASSYYTIRNSIFANNTNWHVEPSIVASVTTEYTNFWNPASCNCTPGSGVQFVDPLFNPDFTLQATSTLIDAGDPNASYDDAIPPGQGGVRNDMGAFGGPGASGIIGTRTPFTP